jgi:hypothetical protein
MNNNIKTIIHYKNYVACWFDSSISDFLMQFPRASKSMAFALITSLDSDLSPSKLLAKSPELKPISTKAKPLGNGFIIPTSLILKEDIKIFHGFDEVWFFPHDKISPKPKTAWLVGPNRIDQANLNKLGSWITENECSLAMGDGDGLNFIVKAHGLVKYMLAYSMSQPQPVAGGEEEEIERVSYGST